MLDPKKVLETMNLLELDDEEQLTEEEVNFQYCCLEILNHIGTEDFKSIYQLLSPEIKETVTQEQLTFARDVLSRIQDVYQFNFTDVLVEAVDDTENVFKLLEFLEYDHLSFLVDLFEYFKEDPLKVSDINFFLETNKEKIDQYTNTFIRGSRLIIEFLRTYNWDDFKKYLNKIIEKNIIEISIELRTKGEQNGRP